MSHALHDRESLAAPAQGGLWPLWLVLAVLALLVLVSASADWYSRQVSLPRYCDDPEAAVARLASLHSVQGRLPNKTRRDYMVAAKLEFLLPRESGESDEAYRLRLRDELRKQCHESGVLGQNSLILTKA